MLLSKSYTIIIRKVKKLAKNEVVFHNQLAHPNIIQLLGHFIDREKETTYMILEYADGGTLFDKLKNEIIPKEDIKKYFNLRAKTFLMLLT